MATLIEAHYRLTTPLFCGGADPKVAELRLPSFKGVLRFWWRALAWSRCEGNLAEIQQQENLLFGSAGGGQARVVMRLGSHSPLDTVRKDDELTVARGDRQVVGMGARYLGYGLMEAFDRRNAGLRAGQLGRACLRAPLDFTVQLRATRLDTDLQETLVQALIALGTFGGMGSRSRRGYGSLTLKSLTVDGASTWQAPRHEEALLSSISALQRQANRKGQPEYTALSSGARHVVLTSEDCREPLHLLDLVGREMVRFRSWGKFGKILRDVPTERNFTDDHNLMDPEITPVRERGTHPERIAFGLPHNYGPGPSKQVPFGGKFDRRASPLLIHIHQCGSRPVAVLSFLPARFLPASGNGGRAQINVGGKAIQQQPENVLYKPIHDFLDRLLGRTPPPKERKEPFTTALEVQP